MLQFYGNDSVVSWTLAISVVHGNRQAATMRHFLRPKRDVQGNAACRPDENYRGVRAVIYRAGIPSFAVRTNLL